LDTKISFYVKTGAAQRLQGNPSGTPKQVEYGNSISVACTPDSTEAAIDLKWFGPKFYFPLEGEKNLIKSKSEMPVDPDTRSPSRFVYMFLVVLGDTLLLG